MNKVPLAIEAMQERLGVQFDGLEIFDTQDGERVGFYVAIIRGARVYFDHKGKPWMNEAEIARAFEMTKQATNNAVGRLADSKLSRLGRVHNLFTHDQLGRRIATTLYNQSIVASILTRSQNPSDQALEFLEEREWIIDTVYEIILEYSTRTDEHNARLRAELGESELRAHHAEVDLQARWEQELVDRYPEELGEQ